MNEIALPSQTVVDKLLLLKLYEDRIKVIKRELQEEIPLNSSHKTDHGKVTHSEASRITIDGKALYEMLCDKGINPSDYGPCSVKCTEKDLELMISNGELTSEEVSTLFSTKEYSTLRITPTKDAKEMFITAMNSTQPLLAKEDDDHGTD
tara:strand:+ start:199 stop:648 length:450 start_codon:yes stop_codon:yes gene_type:complete